MKQLPLWEDDEVALKLRELYRTADRAMLSRKVTPEFIESLIPR